MRFRWLVMGGLALGATALASACGSDSATVGGGEDAGGGSETGSPTDDGSTTPLDGGDDGGEIITDGGSNIDPDAGPDDAGLPDGGACNAVTNGATAIVSTCISILPTLNGGALVAGTYHLTAVAALGTPSFCANQFVPTGFKETLDLTVNSGTGTLNTVFEIGGPPEHHRTATLTPGVNDSSPGTGQATCPTLGTAGPVRYASRLSPGGKQVLLALLPYGKGAAVYRFEKQ